MIDILNLQSELNQKLHFNSIEEGEKNLNDLKKLLRFPFNLITDQSMVKSYVHSIELNLHKMRSNIAIPDNVGGFPIVSSNFIQNYLKGKF